MNKKLSQEQINSIKNYNTEIITIEDFVEIVRKRPGMYLGPIGNLGHINMIREIAQNGFDQIIRSDSPADHLIISYDEITKETIVEDNGLGIPFDNIVRIFTSQHTSSNFEAVEGKFQAGLHGIGSKVTNAFSSSFIVQSFILGEGREMEFADGKPVYENEKRIVDKTRYQGTVVKFRPSEEALGPITTTVKDTLDLILLILPLMPAGIKVYFNSINKNGKVYNDVLNNVDGLFDYIKGLPSILKVPIYLADVSPTMKMECCFTFDPEFNSSVLGFGNFCPTASGTHFDGFISGVGYWFKNYMNNIYLSSTSKAPSNGKKKISNKLVIELSDINSVLRGVIHACHIEPIFTGQAKEKLSNQEIVPYVKGAISKGLDEWASKNPQDLQRICKFLKEVGELRIAETTQKLKLSSKNVSAITGYPAKFVKPTGPKHIWEEFYVVEGDSALGTGKNATIQQIQGLLPIRGKLPNAFNKSPKDILENEECSAIFNIIGGGYGKTFDLSKVPWKRVCIMADADVDGGHIATLFLILMLVYCKPLVEDGRVYKAIPPLYGVEIKGKWKYFADTLDYAKYCQKEFSKKHNILYFDNDKIMSNIEILNTVYTNQDYVYEIDKMSSTYAIDPLLLETLLINRTSAINDIKRSLKQNPHFRFIKDIRQFNKDTIVVDGLINQLSNTAFLNDKLLKECSRIIDIMNKNNNFYFKLDNSVVSLYELMKLYNKEEPKGVKRFKGLGEMGGKGLRESTLDPEGSRCIIRYTVNDIVEEVNILRHLNSNMRLIGEGVTINRLDLMD